MVYNLQLYFILELYFILAYMHAELWYAKTEVVIQKSRKILCNASYLVTTFSNNLQVPCNTQVLTFF